MNRYDEAKAIGQTAASKKLASPPVHQVLHQIALMQNDDETARRELAAVAGAEVEARLYEDAANYQDAMGRLKLSADTLQKGLDVAKRHGLTEMPANAKARESVREAAHGFTVNARKTAADALSLPLNRYERGAVAFAYSLTGDTALSQKVIDQVAKEFPEDTAINYSVVPTVRAFNLLHQNKATEAITVLEAARKYELSARFQVFWVIHARGSAYLQLHDGAKAAVEFQNILDHRGLNPISAFLPLAQLNLARAYALQGDASKARTAYQDFFALWKDADPDIPVLLAGKSEYAKLK
jgi:eukaryotic-like serine/threonine-protein kinase